MSTLYVDQLANTIRTIDGNNQASPAELGATLANHLVNEFGHNVVFASEIVALVEEVNPDKQLGAGVLAEKILDYLGLDLDGKPTQAA